MYVQSAVQVCVKLYTGWLVQVQMCAQVFMDHPVVEIIMQFSQFDSAVGV